MEKIINIEGMTCNHCTNHVKQGLLEIDGITEVAVSLENKAATIKISKEISEDLIKETIYELGYEVISIE